MALKRSFLVLFGFGIMLSTTFTSIVALDKAFPLSSLVPKNLLSQTSEDKILHGKRKDFLNELFG